MPKLKTHQGAAKRFRLTKQGKLMRMKAGRGHLRRKKNSAQNSDYRHAVPSEVTANIKMVKAIAGQAIKK